jgi:hypothetical protein
MMSFENSFIIAHDLGLRLRNMLNDAESVQATLVPPEVVMKHTEFIKMLKQELLAKDTVHKNLIDRYSTLKAVVEAAHSKLDTVGGKYNN